MQITPGSYFLERSHATMTPKPVDSLAHKQLTFEAKADPTKPNSYSVEHMIKTIQPDEPPKRTTLDPSLGKPSHIFLSIALYNEQTPLIDTFA